MMIWIGIGIGVVAIVALLVLVARLRAYRLAPSDNQPIDDVDPLFTTGITLAGAGVALALTIGPFMYLMFLVGMVVMAFGAYRTRKRTDR